MCPFPNVHAGTAAGESPASAEAYVLRLTVPATWENGSLDLSSSFPLKSRTGVGGSCYCHSSAPGYRRGALKVCFESDKIKRRNRIKTLAVLQSWFAKPQNSSFGFKFSLKRREASIAGLCSRGIQGRENEGFIEPDGA